MKKLLLLLPLLSLPLFGCDQAELNQKYRLINDIKTNGESGELSDGTKYHQIEESYGENNLFSIAYFPKKDTFSLIESEVAINGNNTNISRSTITFKWGAFKRGVFMGHDQVKNDDGLSNCIYEFQNIVFNEYPSITYGGYEINQKDESYSKPFDETVESLFPLLQDSINRFANYCAKEELKDITLW